MPAAASLRLMAGDHVVHFYDDAGGHVHIVCDHLAAALRAGDSAMIVARSSRCDDIAAGLAAAAVDVSSARRSGRLFTADADAMLAEFMVGSSPDPDRFEAVIGGMVRGASAGGRLHVYGEMVGLLWDVGNVTAAIELEDLWIRLSDQISFSLICGYHQSARPGAAEVDAFPEVCHRHSAVIGGAPFSPMCDTYRRFACSTRSSRAARLFVDDTLRDWSLGHVTADALLIVSELAANAVLHGNSDFTVGLTRSRDTMLIGVGDSRHESPTVRDIGLGEAGGRGLQLVTALATQWGTDVVADGKLVWAELRTDRAVTSPAQPPEAATSSSEGPVQSVMPLTRS